MSRYEIARNHMAQSPGRWHIRATVGESLIEGEDLAIQRRGGFDTRIEAQEILAIIEDEESYLADTAE